MRITYADQELFQETFEHFRQVCCVPDDELLRETASWVGRIHPSFGFEEALARDLLILSTYLAHHRDRKEVADLARGALTYVLRADSADASGLPTFGLFDDAFIASFAVHEIRTQLGERAHYAPPKLAPLEQKHAEELFLSLIENGSTPDPNLASQASNVVSGLGILAESGIFRRLRNNVNFLSGILSDSSLSKDHRDVARAALEYVVRGEDAIPDELGLAGFLDDNFIAQLAVDLIEPRRDPWLELLDSLVGSWPFLSNFFLGEDGAGNPLSEFLLVNSALICPSLRGAVGLKSLTIVTPSPGPLPFLLGFFSSLGSLYEASLDENLTHTFRPGQKVLVDFTCVREFGGFENLSERDGFWLESLHHSKRAGHSRSRQWLPLSNLRRLMPADQKKKTRGSLLSSSRRKETAVPALDVLLSLRDSHGAGMKPQPVFVASQVFQTRELAARLSIFDEPLCDVIPMGHLSGTDQIVRWSTLLGAPAPVLVTTPDLDYACEYAEESGIVPRLVIVDGEGRNAGRTASHARFMAMGSPVVIVAGMGASVRSTPSQIEAGTDTWEWTKADLDTLIGPEEDEPRIATLSHYEKRIRRAFTASISSHVIDFPQVKKVFAGLSELRASIRERGEDSLPELDIVIERTFPCLLRLVRSLVPLNAIPTVRDEIKADLTLLGEQESTWQYFSDKERAAATAVRDGLSQTFESLLDLNPKAEFLKQHLPNMSSKAMLCAELDRVGDAIRESVGADVSLLSSDLSGPAEGHYSELLISAWFGRRTMTELLLPPFADSLTLLLYDIEHSWYLGFDRTHRRARQAASHTTRRADMFPGIPGWKQPDAIDEKEAPSAPEIEYGIEQSIQQHIGDVKRQRFLRQSQSDGSEAEVDAWMVLFEGGMCAFLAEGYRAKVATHLLDVTEVGKDAELESVPVSRLRVGDALLFLQGSSSDVIRTVADGLLPPNTRNLATLWQRSLRDYFAKESLTAEELRIRLNSRGCPLGVQAIRIWLKDEDIIGPLSYERDVAAIAELTNDPSLKNSLEECTDAISRVRGAHLRASHVLAQDVVRKAVTSLRSGTDRRHPVQVTDQVVLVRIAQIDDRPKRVRSSLLNRLLEDIA